MTSEMMKQLMLTFVLCLSIDNSVQDGYDKRPEFFPIYPQKMNVQYEAGFKHTKDGVAAAYRNDQRQEYVNNVAYKHGTGLGTAPWYGVPGTAYDFGKSKSAGATYHTDASHPTGYGYQGSLSQYHSQPTYSAAGYGKAAKEDTAGKSGQCSCRPAERFDIQHANNDATKYRPRADQAATPAGYRPAVIGGSGDGGYGIAVQSKGYNEAQRAYPNTAAGSKVGYDELTVPAGYVSGRYESVGYGYMY